MLLYVLMNSARGIVALEQVDFDRRPMVPLVHNLPTAIVQQTAFYPLATDTCLKWFAYDFAASKITGPGLSLIDRVTNDPMSEYCGEAGRLTPYFKRTGSQGIVKELVQHIKELNTQPYAFGMPTKGLEKVPDGAVFFKDIDTKVIDVKLMINDMRLTEYHLNNGVTKISFKLNEFLKKKLDEKLGDIRSKLKNPDATFPVDFRLASNSWSPKASCRSWTSSPGTSFITRTPRFS